MMMMSYSNIAAALLVLILLPPQKQQQEQQHGHNTASAFLPPIVSHHHHYGFTSTSSSSSFSFSSSFSYSKMMMTVLPPATDVWVLPTDKDVADAVHTIVKEAAKIAIEERGHFALAIPGGSVLKILSSMDVDENNVNVDDDSPCWTSKMTLAYVNHKCVPNDDRDRAIHAQARAMFLNKWNVSDDQVVRLDDSSTATDATIIAADYQTKLEALPESILPRHPVTGYPIFDLMLIGVGDDGHIGSLYPNQPHVDVHNAWTVGIIKSKGPSSISLSLPVMQHAKFSVVAAGGQSVKYPQGKAGAMRDAIADPTMTPQTFPACALRDTAIWILDEPNASKLNTGTGGAEDNDDVVVSVRTDTNYRERRRVGSTV